MGEAAFFVKNSFIFNQTAPSNAHQRRVSLLFGTKNKPLS
jgi:hypothetical protein